MNKYSYSCNSLYALSQGVLDPVSGVKRIVCDIYGQGDSSHLLEL
jgi:hypothetical protein